ncbi:hypothetical protein RhiirA5_430483 [Rhizophagus irregularis]|uniref:Uncharacterized protein n=1 Tax=Rhizophagus irregularis TaxID=588596 RepID=A0A2N0NWM6_9GLOM|nr:hypothetical protein RhiirA5_430483 [Rhizophagus irregularis]
MSPTSNAASKSTETGNSILFYINPLMNINSNLINDKELQRKDMNNETAYDQCNNSQDDNQIVDTAELQSVDELLDQLDLHVIRNCEINTLNTLVNKLNRSPVNEYERSLSSTGYQLPSLFFYKDGGFPFSTCPMSNPPENLQNPEDKSWLDQYIIDKVLRDNKLNNEWLYNNLWNELYSLFLQTRNLDVSNKLLKDFVMTMYTSLNAMQIRDSLADHLRALYNSLRQKYNKDDQLLAMDLSDFLVNENIQQVFKQWTGNISPDAIKNASNALKNVILIEFRSLESADSQKKAYDIFFNLHTDLYTVNLDFPTNYNIGTSIDLSPYNFVSQNRKSSQKKLKITMKNNRRPKGSKKKTGNNTILNKSKSRANKRQVSINKITPPRNKTSSVARKNKNLDEDEDYSQENEENINEEELLKNLSDMNYEEDHNSEDSLEIASLERGSEVRSRHEAIPPSQTPGRSLEVRSRHDAIPPSRTSERSSEVRSRHDAISPSRTPERSSEVRSRHDAILLSRTLERERSSEVRSRHDAIPPSRTQERGSKVRSRYDAIPPLRTPERSSVVRSRPLSQTERSSTPSSTANNTLSSANTIANYVSGISNNSPVLTETGERILEINFNATLRELASKLKESRRIENINTITMPSQNIIEEFISKEVVIRKVLARYFVTTNETELRRNGSLDRLVRFVQEAFKIHYKDSNKKKIKDLDVMTKDLVIPLQSGYNFASSLTLTLYKRYSYISSLQDYDIKNTIKAYSNNSVIEKPLLNYSQITNETTNEFSLMQNYDEINHIAEEIPTDNEYNTQ